MNIELNMGNNKKNDKYKEEQENTINNLLKILELDKNKTFVLHEVENNATKIKQINELAEDVKKYFPCNLISGAKQPEKVSRPWLSIIKYLLKRKYNLVSSDHRIKENEKVTRTRIFYIIDEEKK